MRNGRLVQKWNRQLFVLLEEIIENEKLGKEQLEKDLGKKKNEAEKEKLTAEDVQKQAMERMGERSKKIIEEVVCAKKKDKGWGVQMMLNST